MLRVKCICEPLSKNLTSLHSFDFKKISLKNNFARNFNPNKAELESRQLKDQQIPHLMVSKYMIVLFQDHEANVCNGF